MRIIDYTLSDVFTLDPKNRWVLKAQLVPWEMAEEKYSHMFRKNGRKAAYTGGFGFFCICRSELTPCSLGFGSS